MWQYEHVDAVVVVVVVGRGQKEKWVNQREKSKQWRKVKVNNNRLNDR